jgi:hypothetical protein
VQVGGRWEYRQGNWVRPGSNCHDTDNDGICDRHDRDRDGDGIRNSKDKDRDGDGIRNNQDARPNLNR